MGFTIEYHATVVGEGGTILTTSDGGNNWISRPGGLNEYLRGVYFTDANTGTIVGRNGTILRTTNGGEDWINQSLNINSTFIGVYFTDINTGTIVGQGGKILRTTDGGGNWIYQNSGTTKYLYAVCFYDQNNGIAVGQSGTILRTTNGGINWISQQSGYNSDLNGVSFVTPSEAYVVGWGGTILKTINGGFLPVELSSLGSNVSEDKITLYWSTATETNNHGFEIQRKSEDVDWSTIGFKEGMGTTTEPHSYSYTDLNLTSGKYSYRLKQVDFNGTYNYSNVVEAEIAPSVFSLSQNYPNPFNPNTTIKYQISEYGRIILTVYDVLGREIKELVNERKPAGTYEVTWNAEGLPSGVYFYQIKTDDFIQTKKMILLK